MERPTQLIYQRDQALLVRRAAVLRVLEGPDAGASCPLALRRTRVGTAADNDLVLSDEQVSRHHLEVQVQDLGYLVRDLGSTNGTYFRGARLREALLGPAAELRLGATALRVELGEELSEVVDARSGFGGLIGSAPAMQDLYGLLAAVAPTDVTVLIEGETGTGKELVAEELHQQSPRRDRPFLVVDCGALPPALIESELFGHERGAFTGAEAARVGTFEEARGGTVFLDEIGELPLPLQTRLLRVLDRRTVRRLGSNRVRSVDVRVVAATNRDLSAEVQAGRFRQDLFYRLAVVRLRVPALRDRLADLVPLARHFLAQAGCAEPRAVLTPEVVEALQQRRWPGNVRELGSFVQRAVLLAGESGLAAPASLEEPAVAAPASRQPPLPSPRRVPASSARHPPRADLPGPGAAGEPPPVSSSWLAAALPPGYLDRPLRSARDLLIQQFERLYLGRLLEQHGTNISALARQAGVDRVLVRRLLRKHGLQGGSLDEAEAAGEEAEEEEE